MVGTARLFPVILDPALLQQLEPYVRIVVDLAKEPPLEFGNQLPTIDRLERLVASWAHLGLHAALPAQDVSSLEMAQRREVFRSCGFRFSSDLRKTDKRIEWLVQYDALSQVWLDILLNCLEAFHVNIAPIARVEVTSEPEGASFPEAHTDTKPAKSAARKPTRRRLWGTWWLR